MSEHIQPGHTAAGSHLESEGSHSAAESLRTPGVAHESEVFNFRIVIWVGVGLAAVVVAVQIVLWWMLPGFERLHALPTGSVSELALEEANRPLGQRVDNVPGPHLEGIERESSLLEILTESGEKKRFFTSVDVRVQIGENHKAGLFELKEGQRVTLAYYQPGGVGGALGVVTSVTSPPVKVETKKPEPELPEASRTLNGEILKIEPRSIADSRKWAEVQSKRFGWIDREKGIVHIPVEKAMEVVLRSKEFRTNVKQKKATGGKR